ncbi:YfcL protein [Ferrimonas balearica DSM 9799]|uniref:YfcL protein n=1 Tax=Ferrimonas balearica (strain DSM 9799 / CCM 4581 / KCTC 23876 / PAT) TaxID=550540 RepID=E1SQ47_FERBD|nr:YfcL family protein [Ferrimonas balearica]ADN76819.1 YfcL protein [Ferrimonas balearica DSM 9799]
MLERWDEICHQWVAEHLENGSDDEVFASGYLQGHFAVVLAGLEQQAEVSLTDLESRMEAHLEQARSELAPGDMALVQGAWAELAQRLS